MTPIRMGASWAPAKRPPRLAAAASAAECLRSDRRDVFIASSRVSRLFDRPFFASARQYLAGKGRSQRGSVDGCSPDERSEIRGRAPALRFAPCGLLLRNL